MPLLFFNRRGSVMGGLVGRGILLIVTVVAVLSVPATYFLRTLFQVPETDFLLILFWLPQAMLLGWVVWAVRSMNQLKIDFEEHSYAVHGEESEPEGAGALGRPEASNAGYSPGTRRRNNTYVREIDDRMLLAQCQERLSSVVRTHLEKSEQRIVDRIIDRLEKRLQRFVSSEAGKPKPATEASRSERRDIQDPDGQDIPLGEVQVRPGYGPRRRQSFGYPGPGEFGR